MPPIVKAGAAFFCEDVRTEDNGKFMFIGTYTGAMTSTVNPATLYVSLVVIVRSPAPAEARMQLVVSHGDKKLADADVKVEITEAGNTFCVFPPLLMDDVTETMAVTVQAKIDDEPWELLYTAPFEVPDAGAADRLPPPSH